MPPPIVPAPTTAAVSTGRSGVVSGMCGSLRVKRQGAGGLDGFDAGIGGALVAGTPRDRFAERIEHAGIGFGLGKLVVAVADARQRAAVGDPSGKGDRRPSQIILRRDLVDDAEPVRLLGRNMAS